MSVEEVKHEGFKVIVCGACQTSQGNVWFKPDASEWFFQCAFCNKKIATFTGPNFSCWIKGFNEISTPATGPVVNVNIIKK